MMRVVLKWMRGAALVGVMLAQVSGAEMRVLMGKDGKALPIRNPYGVTVDVGGALLICDIDNHRVWEITREGEISSVGSGAAGYAGDGGTGREAKLNEPYEVRALSNGTVYFVEMRNHLIRKVDDADRIWTVAGTGKPGFAGDGDADGKTVQFAQPHSLQFGPDGMLYVCDIGNHRVRRVDPGSGKTETFAGNGKREKTPDGARFAEVALNGPRALDFDSKGDMWLALREGNAIYRLDMKAGTIHHIAGTGAKGFGGNGGPAKLATLSGPKGLSIGRNGWVYFADTESHSVRAIDPATGLLHLVAGTGRVGSKIDSDPLQTEMNRPHGIYVQEDGTIYIGDSENHRVLVIEERSTSK